ncbi:unnamed protein product, partial [Polarella glacialis]
ALQTPLLLLRSGIGHPAELSRLGIPVRVASEHVGAHLQDHLYLPLRINTGLPCGGSSNATAGRMLVAFYGSFVVGSDASGRPSGGGTRWRRQRRRDIELQLSPVCVKAPGSRALLSYKAYLILMESKTAGRVVARSADPRDPPVVLFDPFAGDGADALALLRHARELYALLRALGPPELQAELSFEPAEEVLADDGRGARYCSQNLGLWQHPLGTARIGAVVDERLAVIGTEGLHVADASALPGSALAGHPDAGVRALGSLAAMFVAEAG